MSNILDTIVAEKKKEVEELKRLVDLWMFKKTDHYRYHHASLAESLKKENSTGIIAEFKRKSPSKGWFKSEDTKVYDIVRAYQDNGAAGISILTDYKFFGGTTFDLSEATFGNTGPFLRKDFIIDEFQIYESNAYGADVILLIAAILTREQVKHFASLAKNQGLEVLLEIHNKEELDHICDEVDFVGVNNRNLKTLEVDINTSLDLINKIPKNKIAITESGISDVNTIITLRQAGFKGFLIGENFMKQPDPSIAFTEFVNDLKAKSV